MSRIRTIKPELYLDEDFARLSIPARYLFPGLFTISDKRGRLEDRPQRIKAQLYPYDNVDIVALLDELVAASFLVRYTVASRPYLHIRTFERHQRPHHQEPESRLPAPPSDRDAPSGDGDPPEDIRDAPARHRLNPLGREGKGNRNGGGKGTSPAAPATHPGLDSEPRPANGALKATDHDTATAHGDGAPLRGKSWSMEAVDAWVERFGGTAPKAMFTWLKPLVDRHGWEAVKGAWTRYLAEKDPEFANPKDFADKFSAWRDGPRARAQPARGAVDQAAQAERLRAWAEKAGAEEAAKAAGGADA